MSHLVALTSLCYDYLMQNSFDEKILEEAHSWIGEGQSVVLATVIQTWGSSPRPVGSRMVVNQHGDFSGSVSGYTP